MSDYAPARPILGKLMSILDERPGLDPPPGRSGDVIAGGTRGATVQARFGHGLDPALTLLPVVTARVGTKRAGMDQVTSWAHRAQFPGESASAASAREFVHVHLIEHGFSGLVEDVCLVASELATNAVLHAQTPFTVTLRGDSTSVLLTVRDGSPLAPLLVAARVMDEGGRGIAIVRQLSHRWGTTTSTDGAKSVWAWFDRHPIS